MTDKLKEIILKMREGNLDLNNEIYWDCDGSIFQQDTGVELTKEEFSFLEENGIISFEQVVQGQANCYIITQKGKTMEL